MKTTSEMEKERLLQHLKNTVAEDASKVIFSGNYIPTLENFPASNWRRKKKLEEHVGDIFIKNPKYIYKLSKKEDGTFFWKQEWQKDNLDNFISAMDKKRRKRRAGGWI